VPGEVDDGINLLIPKEAVGPLCVTQVERVDAHLLAGDRLEPVDHRRLGVAEVVHDQDIVAGGKQLDYRVRADETGSTGDENMHVASVCRGRAPVVGDRIPCSHGV